MNHEESNGLDRSGTLTSVHSRELAERSSSGTRVRLLWRADSGRLWVELREPDERVLAIPVEPERALDAFHHPYAYAGQRRLPLPAESRAGS